MVSPLVANSRLQDLLGVGDALGRRLWDEVTVEASAHLPFGARTTAVADAALTTAGLVLLEGQYGPGHFQLSRSKQVYYRLRPLLGARARRVLRHAVVRQTGLRSPSHWPIDDRYVAHVEEATERAFRRAASLEHLVRPFWPDGRKHALVLTHDVESAAGLKRIWDLVAIEERAGVRSSFNLVAGEYTVDMGVLNELRTRGFEVGVHGWRHDGRMFESPDRFARDLKHINRVLAQWQAVGYRSPMTHRDPLLMQGLDIAYDSSFFDSDPFEPIAGGVMTIWPFFMGRFVELPYTLPQDHTLFETMRESSPHVWLRKLAFIRQHQGMALLNSHPEYLCLGRKTRVYEAFLDEVAADSDAWLALPAEVALWWRERWRGSPVADLDYS